MIAVIWSSGCTPSKSGTGWLCTKAKLHRHGLHLEGLQDRGVGVDVDGHELEAAGVATGDGAEGRDEVGRLLEPRRPQHHDDGVPVGRRDDVADRGVSALDDEAGTVRGGGGRAGGGASRLGRTLER